MGDTSERLERAVREAAVTREVVLEQGASAALPGLLARHFAGRRFLLVADDRTWIAAGAGAAAVLDSAGLTHDVLVLPGTPRLKPRVSHAEAIAARIAATGTVPVAIGAGVVNDLVKRAAAVAGQPYAVVGTAASMDGYAASGAALLDGDFKRTLPCPPPIAVLADLHVLAAAPRPMAAWGYGDLAGKIVAGADWILADALEVDPVSPAVFDLVQSGLEGWLQRPDRLAAGDPQALAGLMGGLLVTGFAMQAHGTSRPASGSDHQFAHLWEMEGLAVAGEPVSHGACVGIGTVAMLALYEWLLGQDLSALDIDRAVTAQPSAAAEDETVAAAFPEVGMAASAAAEMAAKRPTADVLRRRLKRLVAVWPDLRPRLAARLPSAARMQARLATVGAPSHPSEIGVGPAALAADYRRARLIRRRYTLLDLLADMGRLDEAVDALFAPGGFWGRPAEHASSTR